MSNLDIAAKSPLWRLNKFVGYFATAQVSGSCDLLTPDQGLHELAIDGSPLAGARLLGLSLPPVSSESAISGLEGYTRRGDLVGIYAPTDAQPFRSQAYWRLASHDLGADPWKALAAIELVASKQTDLLDSRPDLSVSSRLPCITAWLLTDVDTGSYDEIDLHRKPVFSRTNGVACFVFRLPGNSLSYAEMVYPLDFETSELARVNNAGKSLVRTEHQLFVHRLEKGVILRARVLGLLLNRDDDLRVAAAHYAQFAASDPPLTT